VVTIGIFDGVHMGHVKILGRIRELSSAYKCESVVVTLWPHPRTVLQPGIRKMNLLSTLDEKIELISRQNIDNLIILPFTKEFSEITFDSFVTEFLVKPIGVKHLVMGFNHHFGKDREGSYQKLQKLALENGFTVERLDPVIINETKVSSSGIRSMLEEGRIQAANTALGYSYFIDGTVVNGSEIGRKIGFPTANIEPDDVHKLIPMTGVYAAGVLIGGQQFKGMLNIGFRPTFTSQKHDPVVEVNIFDFNQSIYGSKIRVYFHEWMRCEKKFNSVDALKEQLETDKKEVLKFFASFKVNLPRDN